MIILQNKKIIYIIDKFNIIWYLRFIYKCMMIRKKISTGLNITIQDDLKNTYQVKKDVW